MIRQSRAPTPAVLLTRPQAQGARFAAALAEALGEVRIVTSPLMAPEFLSPRIEARPEALVFTSETGVEAFRRLETPALRGVARAWCVGNRTAQAARAAGLRPQSADGDAEALVAAGAAAGAGVLVLARASAGSARLAAIAPLRMKLRRFTWISRSTKPPRCGMPPGLKGCRRPVRAAVRAGPARGTANEDDQ